MTTETGGPPRWRLVLAFALVYVIWGSTYLAIRFAIETVPPLLMAGLRYLIAGGILYVWARLRGEPHPRRAELLPMVIIGAALFLGGNGGVVTAEQWVPSGITALMVASEPFWVIVLNWLRPRGEAPTGRVVLGLALGFAGVFFLVSPFHSGVGVELRGALILLGGTLCWASGSLYSRTARLPKTPWMSVAGQMLSGGALLVVAASATGEWSRLDLAAVSTKSVLAITYLIVFGALVAFSAYAWILRVAHPAAASTYAFVNPLVAVILGWLFAGEEITSTTLAAGGLILAGVVLITLAHSRGATRIRRRPWKTLSG